MADMTELKNIVRLGTVQSVNASKMTARVKFKDKTPCVRCASNGKRSRGADSKNNTEI